MTAAAQHAPSTAGLDAQAFRAVYDAHFDHVWLSLRRLGVRHADLEDAAHEVFIVFLRRIEAYDPERPVRAWLSGIAYRVAANLRRRDGRRAEASLEKAPAQVDPGPSPERRVAEKQGLALVYEALESLDLDQRAAFVMHEIDGVAMPAVAEALEVPLNTCYSRLRLGRGKFAAAVTRIRAREGLR